MKYTHNYDDKRSKNLQKFDKIADRLFGLTWIIVILMLAVFAFATTALNPHGRALILIFGGGILLLGLNLIAVVALSVLVVMKCRRIEMSYPSHLIMPILLGAVLSVIILMLFF